LKGGTVGNKHTDKEFEGQLDELRNRLLKMAVLVEAMVADAVRALVTDKPELAKKVISQDSEIDQLEMKCDELCLRILALRQPMGSDLRFITLALKMVTDLERMGDLAVNISERALDVSGHPKAFDWDLIDQMAAIVGQMIRSAIDAFVNRDEALAHATVLRDREVDELYTRSFNQILEAMRADPEKLHDGLHAQSIAKWLERMGDHCTNLAEQVVFLVRGKDIRHAQHHEID
jgi:phosphate transport system protein